MSTLDLDFQRVAALLAQFDETSDEEVLRRAFAGMDTLLSELERLNDSRRLNVISLRAHAYLRLGILTSDPLSFDLAIGDLKQLLKQADAASTQRAGWHTSYALALRKRFEATISESSDQELNDAIEHSRRAAELFEACSAERANALSTLAGHYRAIWEHFGELAALDGAIKTLTCALVDAPPDSVVARLLESNLASALLERDRENQDPESIDRAVDLANRAYRLAGRRSEVRHGVCVTYVNSLIRRYAMKGASSDLDELEGQLKSMLGDSEHGQEQPFATLVYGALLLHRYRASNDRDQLKLAGTLASAVASPFEPDQSPGQEARALLAALLIETAEANGSPALLCAAWLNNIAASLSEATCSWFFPKPHENIAALERAERTLLKAARAIDVETAEQVRRAVDNCVHRFREGQIPSAHALETLTQFVLSSDRRPIFKAICRSPSPYFEDWPGMIVAAGDVAESLGQQDVTRLLLSRSRDAWRLAAAAYLKPIIDAEIDRQIQSGVRRQAGRRDLDAILELLTASNWQEETASLASEPGMTIWADFIEGVAHDADIKPISILIRALADLLRLVATHGVIETIASKRNLQVDEVAMVWTASGGERESLQDESSFAQWLINDDSRWVRSDSHATMHLHWPTPDEVQVLLEQREIHPDFASDLIQFAKPDRAGAWAPSLGHELQQHGVAKEIVRGALAGDAMGLYLRSFRSETTQGLIGKGLPSSGQQFTARSFDRDGEALIANLCAPHGAMVAIANSLDHAIPVHVPRIYIPPHEWRNVVTHLIRTARFIVVSISGSSEGLMFELETIAALSKCRHTLIVVEADEVGSTVTLLQRRRPYRWSPLRIARLSQFGTVVHRKDLCAAHIALVADLDE